jgi:pentose-5-phosphate-3-epimerase
MEAGANVLVAGQSVFGQADPAGAVRSFKALWG